MKHADNCKCELCQPQRYIQPYMEAEYYRTKTSLIEAESISYIGGGYWLVNYRITSDNQTYRGWMTLTIWNKSVKKWRK